MNIKKVPPNWQRLGFNSEEEMNLHEQKYKQEVARAFVQIKNEDWAQKIKARREKEK
ncbi:hypothetical protein lacNasYZ03_11400 [Lactobacillus nasalidis]|uniref:Uncharacterized protein n=1 Tax=Lactobacillus nasalidis TaxID=2797258 RepID=A0ABQ3W5Y4_9LACO|nr:hypothetical protein [Lactobacillus nasalidis]GHV97864.1 hypothetical protein lacNasYZ01_10460 [Lactobacillus nasalidis]GHW00094.1 hypothetical protein lacNasYZ02_15230 [Lactobacillus nasalidis]GHW01453.1 hypothetical protein lacNasYZ03_11400 [Lactobacillus nasalidis]